MDFFNLKARELTTNKIYTILEMHFCDTSIDVVVQIEDSFNRTYGQKVLTIYKRFPMDNEVELIFE
jgi:hypothetical protein